MARVQITVELVTTKVKTVKGNWDIIAVKYGEDSKIVDDTRGYTPDQDKEVTEVRKAYQQEIETDSPEVVIHAIIRAANGMAN